MAVVIRFTDDVDIPVGDGVQVEIDGMKLDAVIIGHISSDVLFISPPPIKKQNSLVREGGKISGRFLSRSKPFGFESSVVKIYEEPVAIWAVAFPDRFQSLSVRKSERVNTFVPGSVKNSQGELFSGTLLDISDGGGLFAVGKGEFELDENVWLSTDFPEGKSIADLLCEVRHMELRNETVLLGLRVADRKNEAFQVFSAYYNLVSGHFTIPENIHSIYPI